MSVTGDISFLIWRFPESHCGVSVPSNANELQSCCFTPTCSYWINIPSNAVGGKQWQTCSLLSQMCYKPVIRWSGAVRSHSNANHWFQWHLRYVRGIATGTKSVTVVSVLSYQGSISRKTGQRKLNKQKLTAALFSLRDTSAFQSQNKERSLVIAFLKLMSIKCIKRPQKQSGHVPNLSF